MSTQYKVTWRPVGVVPEGGDIHLRGINPWGLEWQRMQEEPVLLPHPSEPTQRRHPMFIYRTSRDGKLVVFAAGELAPGVWGFYLPRKVEGLPPS